jgi:hypothetical protein
VTPAPTPSPTPTPDLPDPAEANPNRGHSLSELAVAGGEPTAAPSPGASQPDTGTAASLRVLDPSRSSGLIETIVGDVTGVFFGG